MLNRGVEHNASGLSRSLNTSCAQTEQQGPSPQPPHTYTAAYRVYGCLRRPGMTCPCSFMYILSVHRPSGSIKVIILSPDDSNRNLHFCSCHRYPFDKVLSQLLQPTSGLKPIQLFLQCNVPSPWEILDAARWNRSRE